MPNNPSQNRQQPFRRDNTQQSHLSLKAIKSAVDNQKMANFGPEKFAERDGLAEQFIQEIQNDNKAKGLNSTQLRKIFHKVKQLNLQFRSLESDAQIPRAEIALISAQLAYASGRDLIPNDFFDLVTFCLKAERCSTKADFDNVAKLLEALMAYHKYHSSLKSPQGGNNE